MVQITEELVRKRSEHNEGIIGTLEELSLHQEDIEKIEHLNNWCRELQILYLQANLISKIENLNKLKKLQYLNLAINNIEKIENLEGCESLEKLDLTLNFIGDLESVCNLKNNIHLSELYLTGNPCCDFEGYRDYVIAQLPQLKALDLKEITKSEQIQALQKFLVNKQKVEKCQNKYKLSRQQQKERILTKNSSHLSDEDFWQSSSENCPETRVEIAHRQRKNKTNNPKEKKTGNERTLRLFNKDGHPLNINEAKLDFKFLDDDIAQFVLDIAIYKFLDSNLIEVDLQPIYVKVTIKGKVFQIVFPEEISTDKSIAQRSQTTGHLILKLPKANYKRILRSKSKKNSPKKETTVFLEVDPKKDDMDFSKIVENNNKVRDLYGNTDIPPLEYF